MTATEGALRLVPFVVIWLALLKIIGFPDWFVWSGLLHMPVGIALALAFYGVR